MADLDRVITERSRRHHGRVSSRNLDLITIGLQLSGEVNRWSKAGAFVIAALPTLVFRFPHALMVHALVSFDTNSMSLNDHRSTGRVLDVIELLASAAPGLTLSAMATALGCPKSSLFPLLKTLLRRGYVICDDAGNYRLSTRVFELGATSLGEYDLREIARPALKQLSERTGEAVLLAVLASDKTAVLYVDKVENQQHRIRYSVGLGERRPLHSTSTGRIFLAYMPEEQLRQVLASIELTRFTPSTITSRKALLRELEQIRTQGFCINSDQSEIGRCSVAAPIFDYNKEVVAACALGGPTQRIQHAAPALAKAARDTALSISRQLGYAPSKVAAGAHRRKVT